MAEALLSTALFIPLLLLSLSFFFFPANNPAAASPPPPSDFIASACRATPYPSLCVRTLSAAPPRRRSPRELSRAALLAGAGRARSASAFLARARSGSGPARACAARLSGAADRLGAAAREMGRLGRDGARRVGWHVSRARAGCGAALAAERTCLEELARGGDAATREAVADAARVAGVAMALLNRVGSGKCCAH